MTAPAFLLDTDADELADLAALGVDLNMDLNRPISAGELDAIASELLGKMAECDRDLARYMEAQAAELARLTGRYNRITDPIVRRREVLEHYVLEIAKRTDYGSKKSRAVGNGTIGKRTKGEHIKVVDTELALAWAKEHCPLAVKEKITESVVHKSIESVVLARVHATGEVPDGFVHESETEAYYARVEID